MVNVEVDYGTCAGCGTCQVMCPDVFEVREDGKAWILNDEAGDNCDWEEIVRSCPTESITVEGVKIRKDRRVY